MPTTLPTHHGIDPAATTPLPTVDAMPHLSARTLTWLAQRPFPCLVWRQIRGELLGHLAASGFHHRRVGSGRSARRAPATTGRSTADRWRFRA